MSTEYVIYYNPCCHYWLVAGDLSRVWSSKERRYVDPLDVEFASWLVSGGKSTTIDSETSLREVLSTCGFPNLAPGYVPSQIEMWQAKAILRMNNLYDQADTAVTASGDITLQSAWVDGNNLSRNSPGVVAMGSALGLTPAQLDHLFIAAEDLKA